MDDLDKRLLNRIQSEVPLASRPYRALGEALGISEEEVIGRVLALRQEGIIRQVSAIFDTRSLGYCSSLVAMRVDPVRVDEAAEIVNRHPGVSHNYKRDHHFNIWFTIAVPPASSLPETVTRLHELTRAESTRLLPTLRLFKIGVKLDMTGEEEITATAPPAYSDSSRKMSGERSALTAFDIAAIRELQKDLPAIPQPFRPWAENLGLTEEALFEVAHRFTSLGLMRRFSAVLHHRKAGFRANAMGVWKVPDERISEVGPAMASFAGVSHCYQRPTYPDWPYSLFTMIHGRSVAECQKVIDTIAATTGVAEYASLYSTKEYKKVRLTYFTEELDEWEKTFCPEVASVSPPQVVSPHA